MSLESRLDDVLALGLPCPRLGDQAPPLVLADFYHEALACLGPPPEDRPQAHPGRGLESWLSGADYGLRLCSSAWGEPVLTIAEPAGRGPRISLALGQALVLFLELGDPRGNEAYRFFFRLFRAVDAIRRAGAFAPRARKSRAGLRVDWAPLPGFAETSCLLSDLACGPGLELAYSGLKGKEPPSRERLVSLLVDACLTHWAQTQEWSPRLLGPRGLWLGKALFEGAVLDRNDRRNRSRVEALEAWLGIFQVHFGVWRYRLEIFEPEEKSPILRLGLRVLDFSQGLAQSLDLETAQVRYGASVLEAPLALSGLFPELEGLLDAAYVDLGRNRVAAFLGEASSLLGRLGIDLVFSRDLKESLRPRMVLRVDRSPGKSLHTWLDMDSTLRWEWRIALGDRDLSLEEFEALVSASSGLVRYHDDFVRLDPREAECLLSRARKAEVPDALGLLQARSLGEASFSADAEEVLASLFRERDFPLPRGLTAELRPYQERGFRWILSNLLSGFGCLLADDMGLGKTVQAIAVILGLEELGLLGDGVLVLAPAALLLNWQRELRRFAPGLAVAVYHGQGRVLVEGPVVHLSTKETATRDEAILARKAFSLLIVDEAHLLKNRKTKAAVSLRGLRAARRLGLSGTPVENRLEDLRAILDLVFPGYLGSARAFSKAWRRPIEGDLDRARAAELRRITSPFILRRLKADPGVAEDLPPRVEMDEAAGLVPAQAGLYAGIVQRSLEALATAGQSRRQGIILGLITSLKQVCDHPRAYDKVSPPEAELSGKALLLLAILGKVLAGGEKALVFSQYVQVLGILDGLVKKRLGVEALVYHGGMDEEDRDEAVRSFQEDPGKPLMLVSLRAGGLGLNLTAATHVIHYDLWFNPAVEAQATDRSHRIGQARTVFVHRLVTLGTFEERLDAMIKGKRELAEISVASGESWIGRMSDGEIRDLFRKA